MKFQIRFVALVLSSALCFAGSWQGALADSKCYASEERNVNPADTLTSVDRDRGMEVRYCSPGAKTKSFVFVRQDGLSFQLDSAGDAKAAELVRKTGKERFFAVAIVGDITEYTIKVDSISLAK